MMTPRQLRKTAERMEDENLQFRTFLKIHADEDELDRQFLELHRELFAAFSASCPMRRYAQSFSRCLNV